jgi:hypothetical protein
MSFTGGVKYKSRREKKHKNSRNLNIILVAALIALVVLTYKNRHQIWGTIQLYF